MFAQAQRPFPIYHIPPFWLPIIIFQLYSCGLNFQTLTVNILFLVSLNCIFSPIINHLYDSYITDIFIIITLSYFLPPKEIKLEFIFNNVYFSRDIFTVQFTLFTIFIYIIYSSHLQASFSQKQVSSTLVNIHFTINPHYLHPHHQNILFLFHYLLHCLHHFSVALPIVHYHHLILHLFFFHDHNLH